MFKSLIQITSYAIKGHTFFFIVLQLFIKIGIPQESTIVLESYINFDRSRTNCKNNTKHLRALKNLCQRLSYISDQTGIIQEKLHIRQQTAGEGFDGPENLCRGNCCSKYHVTH